MRSQPLAPVIAAAAVALALVAPAAGVEVTLPETDAPMVTVTGLTVPQPPVPTDTSPTATDGATPEDEGVYWYIHQFPSDQQGAGGEPIYKAEWGWGTSREADFEIQLQNAVRDGSVVAVVDALTGEVATAGRPPTGAGTMHTQDIPPEPLIIFGLSPGSETFAVARSGAAAASGSAPPLKVLLLYGAPGKDPAMLKADDGGANDEDGSEDGRITLRVPRTGRVRYALPGDRVVVVPLNENRRGVTVARAESADDPGIRFTVPIVSHVVGASGVPFVSDLTITNPYGLPVSGVLVYVPERGGLPAAAQVPFTVMPGQTWHVDDVLATEFGITDNTKGVLHLAGFPMWNLTVLSRNEAVTHQGRFGITVPGLPSFQALTAYTRWVLSGVRDDGRYRSNLFLAGAVPLPSEVAVYLVQDGVRHGPIPVTVPPLGLAQINRIGRSLAGGDVDHAYLLLAVRSGAVHAGLSVVDGTTEDAAFVLPVPVAEAR